MTFNATIRIQLEDTLSQALRRAQPLLTTDQSWIVSKKMVDALSEHPELKVSRVGTRKRRDDLNQE